MEREIQKFPVYSVFLPLSPTSFYSGRFGWEALQLNEGVDRQENRLVFAKGGRGEYEEDGLGVWY